MRTAIHVTASTRPRPTRVLLVEDNPGDVQLIRERLDGSFSVEHAGRLATAMTTFERTQPDVVLLDLGLPDASGLEGVKELRRRFPLVPLVVVTGASDERLALSAIGDGAQDYVCKEELDEHLPRVIRFALERSRAAEDRRGGSGSPAESTLAAGEVLHRLRLSVLVTDAHARLLWANAAGEALVRGDLLDLRDADLRDAIARAAAGDGRLPDATLPVERAGDRLPLQALVVRLRGGGAPRVAVLVADPESADPPSAEALRHLFGLTPTEARLAQLVAAGLAPKDAARRLGVAWNTVRRHLRSLFAKTGTSRQGELVRLIVGGVLQLRPEAGDG